MCSSGGVDSFGAKCYFWFHVCIDSITVQKFEPRNEMLTVREKHIMVFFCVCLFLFFCNGCDVKWS